MNHHPYPSVAAVAEAVRTADHRGIVDRVEHATPGVPDDGRVHVHLRTWRGADEIRYALEENGWTVTPGRGIGGTPGLHLVTPAAASGPRSSR